MTTKPEEGECEEATALLQGTSRATFLEPQAGFSSFHLTAPKTLTTRYSVPNTLHLLTIFFVSAETSNVTRPLTSTLSIRPNPLDSTPTITTAAKTSTSTTTQVVHSRQSSMADLSTASELLKRAIDQSQR